MKTLKARWNGETPSFFKKIIKLGLYIGGVGAAILGLPTALAATGITIAVPAIVTTVGGYFVAAGAFSASVGKLTVVAPEELPE